MTRDERANFAKGMAFVAPWLVGFAVFTAIPIGLSLYYSFCDYSVLEPLDSSRWPGNLTSRTSPTISRKRMVIHATSISHHICPWRAERGSAWWLLCHPSPLLKNATIALLRLSSSVS